MFDAAHDALYRWYEIHGRHSLPWRNTDDPYAIWISEIMLQQTQVKTVLERFYFPFLEAFPTLADLAAADLDDVLKKWEGLGYYSRAKNLHRAAQLCNGTLPQSVHALQALPGIGKSTAHAIAAFAYKTPVPILDANVKRILFRCFGRRKASEKTLWNYAHRLFDAERPFDFNQAMMDLGAQLCTPRTPACAECPLGSVCKARGNDPEGYPAARARAAKPIRRKTMLIRRNGDRLALRRNEGRFLHGLWGFEQLDPSQTPEDALHLGSLVQVYSHFELHAELYLLDDAQTEAEWFGPEAVASLALSGADRKALNMLEAYGADETGG